MTQPEPLPSIAIVLPGAVETALMQDVVDEIILSLLSEADAALPDGIFPSATQLGRAAKLAEYLNMTDQADWPLLVDDDYLVKYKAGFLPAPISPRWLDALSLPDEFETMRKEFIRLVEEAGKP